MVDDDEGSTPGVRCQCRHTRTPRQRVCVHEGEARQLKYAQGVLPARAHDEVRAGYRGRPWHDGKSEVLAVGRHALHAALNECIQAAAFSKEAGTVRVATAHT